ncbi:MAG: low molecular weight protein arginine phosphatase [Ruminococcaceae bacterium]|nr:low molecular weight protein arginine phosphatase [Oscillospiraceae bacterium]
MHIIFVCTGNTCRSPMAEALLRKKTEAHTVSSAGVSVLFATPAAPNAVRTMQEYGLDISDHRSRQLTAEAVQAADRILTMTGMHKAVLCKLFPDAAEKTETLGEFAGHPDRDVPDPFGGSMETYRACAAEIANLLEESSL